MTDRGSHESRRQRALAAKDFDLGRECPIQSDGANITRERHHATLGCIRDHGRVVA
jgi:hypothetical protein